MNHWFLGLIKVLNLKSGFAWFWLDRSKPNVFIECFSNGIRMAKTLTVLWRLLVFGTALGVGLLFLLRFQEWGSEFQKSLFTTQNWEYLLYLLAFTVAVGYLVRLLIKKEFHLEFVQKRRKRP